MACAEKVPNPTLEGHLLGPTQAIRGLTIPIGRRMGAVFYKNLKSSGKV